MTNGMGMTEIPSLSASACVMPLLESVTIFTIAMIVFSNSLFLFTS